MNRVVVRTVRWYTAIVMVLLAVTGIAKVAAAYGSGRILQDRDPLVFVMSNRQMLLLAAALEALVIGALLREGNILRRVAVVGWIGTVFLAY